MLIAEVETNPGGTTLRVDHLGQFDAGSSQSLSKRAVGALEIKLLNYLKKVRNQLYRNFENDSEPPVSGGPWDIGSKHCDDDQNDDRGLLGNDELSDGDQIPEDDCLKERQQAEATEVEDNDGSSPEMLPRKPDEQPPVSGSRTTPEHTIDGHAHRHQVGRGGCYGQIFSSQQTPQNPFRIRSIRPPISRSGSTRDTND